MNKVPVHLNLEIVGSDSVLGYWLQKHGIPRRSLGRPRYPIDLDEVKEWYLGEKQSINQIASRLGCSHDTVCQRLREEGVVVRPVGLATHIKRGHHISLSRPLLEILEGELLGDGSITSSRAFSARFSETSKYRLYVEWLREQCMTHRLLGEPIRENIRVRRGKQHSEFVFRSFAYEELLILRHRWYPNGRKIIPKDFHLTPRKALHWYLGDGGFSPSRWPNGKPYIILYTNGFSDDDRKILIEELAKVGVETHSEKRGTLYVTAKTTPKFLKYIGPCPKAIEEIYGYKWGTQ